MTARYSREEIDKIVQLTAQRPISRAVLVWPFSWIISVCLIASVWSAWFFATLGTIAGGILIGALVSGLFMAVAAMPAVVRKRRAQTELARLRLLVE